MSDQVVAFGRVEKRYGATVALRQVSLDVARGELFGLIGPDGAGKTTMIRLACGLIRPDAGTVRVLGREPGRERRAITGQVGYLSQRFSLYGDLSIDENIAFFAAIHGVFDYEAPREQLLELTRLTPFRARLADQLSGGMRQKLALACTLVHEPELLLLDEPTTGVDPVSRREFWKLLADFVARGMTIVMTTPYLDEAERCSRVALMHEGRTLAVDAPGRLRASLPGRVVEVLAGPRDAPAGLFESIRAMNGVEDVQAFGGRVRIRLGPGAGRGSGPAGVGELKRHLAAGGLPDAHLRPVQTSLEDVFIARIGDRSSERSAQP